jgi:hypothetical protein
MKQRPFRGVEKRQNSLTSGGRLAAWIGEVVIYLMVAAMKPGAATPVLAEALAVAAAWGADAKASEGA